MLIEQGVSRIILVSHLQGLGEDRELVPQLSGVGIVVAGGGDELLKNEGDTCQTDESAVAPSSLLLADADGNEVLVVTAPGGYRCIGRLEVAFDVDGAVASYEGASIGVPLDGDAEDFATARVEEPLAARCNGHWPEPCRTRWATQLCSKLRKQYG
jgi:2',3'-cyclic-nucleotide 2'-phosphodiesterase (5'-nucleotidase family)